MNNNVSMVGVVLLAAVLGGCGGPAPQQAPVARPAGPPPQVIPVPRDYARGDGAFRLAAPTEVVYSGGADAAQTATYFIEHLKANPEIFLQPAREGSASSGRVAFVLDANAQGFGPEEYALSIKPDGIVVRAHDAAGLFYGAVTLWQEFTIIPPQGGVSAVGSIEIRDAPRFAWRGLMLDSCRHYQSPEFIKQFIDWMALHKLNVLHWHLTDDQAWRLEIKKYPKLTSVGAWRVPAGQAAQTDIDPKTGKPRLHGGFYTQEQARDIVAYAAARHIKVVPEIEMPGHATAAIVAYPALGVPPASNKLTAVPDDWGVYENLYNVEESTFGFLEDVMTEVMDVFPSDYIHVGGDEAVKPQWVKSPRVQARMKELGVKDAHALQGYFIQRMGKFLEQHHRRLIGWDEILDGGVPPDATVMSWRGIDGAVVAAKAGHDTVLSPSPDLYFDHWQSAGDLAPGRSNTLSLQMVYGFQPLPPGLTEEQRKHVLGVQANLWTELMRTEQRVEYMAFPRTAALAEVAWSPAERINWQDFQQRLEPQLRRYDKLGITWAREVKLDPGARRRLSHDLEQCGDGYLLSLEDDAPVDSERAVFLVNISNPCWIWRGADLEGIKSLRATVGQIPFNFQIGADAARIPLRKPATPDGEFEVHLDKCDGPPLATASLSPAVSNFGLTPLPPIPLQVKGKHDLCFVFTRSKIDPIWAIGSLELTGN